MSSPDLQTKGKPSRLRLLTLLTIAMSLQYLIHRIAINLKISFSATGADQLKYFLVGFASDIWVAFLFSFLASIVGFFVGRSRVPKIFFILLIANLVVLTLHLPYFVFFNHPFLLFHFNYLMDIQFVRSQTDSLVDYYIFMQATFLIVPIWIFQKSSFRQKPLVPRTVASHAKSTLGVLTLLLTTLAIHALQIKYKYRWLVPESLQANLFESIFIQLSKPNPVSELTNQEWLKLGVSDSEKKESRELESLLFEDSRIAPVSALTLSFRDFIQNTRDQPIIIIYLMESQRYVDSSFFGYQTGKTDVLNSEFGNLLTPNLVKLGQKGFVFHNNWSTGNVTRGAQEATWCSYPSDVRNSTMRSLAGLQLRCLTDSPFFTSHWIHNGNGKFDSQMRFWKKHSVQTLIDTHSFPESTPQNSWGRADSYLAQKAFAVIHKANRQEQLQPSPFSLSMVLTMSNHAPWKISDGFLNGWTKQQKQNLERFQGHQRTALYADHSLGLFVENLKDSGLWNRTLLLVTGDHGHLETPNPKNVSLFELKARVPFVISGGFTERFLKHQEPAIQHYYNPTSHVDIPFWLETILNLEINPYSFGSDPFHVTRRFPVFSNDGSKIFVPNFKKEISIEQLFSESQSDLDLLTIKAILRLQRLWKASKRDLTQ